MACALRCAVDRGLSQAAPDNSRFCVSGYTGGMKTAVSIPDAIFEQAELFARRTKRSRSQLFSDALSEYLARHSPDEITDAMNRVVDATGEGVDPFTSAASQRTLARLEW